jgi:hypothetical protein
MVSSISLAATTLWPPAFAYLAASFHKLQVSFVASYGHCGGRHPQGCKCNRRLDDLSLGHPVRMLTCMDARFQISVTGQQLKDGQMSGTHTCCWRRNAIPLLSRRICRCGY